MPDEAAASGNAERAVRRGEALARQVCAASGMLLTDEAVTLLQIGVRAGVLAAERESDEDGG